MKLVNQEFPGRQVIEEFHALGALAGHQCQEIRLDWRDVRSLLDMPPERLHSWLQFIETRFSVGAIPVEQQLPRLPAPRRADKVKR